MTPYLILPKQPRQLDVKELKSFLVNFLKKNNTNNVRAGALGVTGLLALIFYIQNRRARRKPQLYRQSSAVLLGDGWSKEIFVPDGKGGHSRVVIKPNKLTTFEAHKILFLGEDRGLKDAVAEGSERKAGVNKQFLRQLNAIGVIMIPNLFCRSTYLLLAHGVFLGLRTWLSLLVASLDGRIVRDLIAGDGKKFAQGILYWFILAAPAAYTNAMIKFLQAKISIEFRTRLTRYIHDIYMDSSLAYYKASEQLEGVDQYITADVTRFCDAAAALYSNLGKPSLDFVIFSYQLSKNLGPMALVGIFLNYGATAWMLKKLAPPFGKLTAVEAKLEGDYRNGHTRLITNAEEIAFYNGTSLERSFLLKTYDNLVKHIASILRIKVSYNMMEDMVLKYGWSAVGYLFASVPVFMPSAIRNAGSASSGSNHKEGDRMKEFITNKRHMLSLADAGGRMMYSIKDLAELAGYTSRVFDLLSTLHRIHDTTKTSGGTLQNGYNGVRFEHVPLETPFKEPLTDKPLDFVIGPGEHMLICGPNGVGKTAIARVLAGLWSFDSGLVSRPKAHEIAFLPQRPYLSPGSLRDQVIYPDSHADMLDKRITDEDLMKILETVNLAYIPGREGGFDTKKNWKDVLSGGEKQRMMFARILYKHPKFAVVDEGTSAVSADMEGLMYDSCKRAGITLLTISHRMSLMKYHTCVLRLGEGESHRGWSFEKTNSESLNMSTGRELASIKLQLKRVPEMRQRKAQIEKALTGH